MFLDLVDLTRVVLFKPVDLVRLLVHDRVALERAVGVDVVVDRIVTERVVFGSVQTFVFSEWPFQYTVAAEYFLQN